MNAIIRLLPEIVEDATPIFTANITDSQDNKNLKSQIAISRWGGTRKLPYAFTRNGVAMLSSVLRSQTAVPS